jgi:hypothetical protein
VQAVEAWSGGHQENDGGGLSEEFMASAESSEVVEDADGAEQECGQEESEQVGGVFGGEGAEGVAGGEGAGHGDSEGEEKYGSSGDGDGSSMEFSSSVGLIEESESEGGGACVGCEEPGEGETEQHSEEDFNHRGCPIRVTTRGSG